MTDKRQPKIVIRPEDTPGVLWDHEKRLNDTEKVIPNLIQRVETNTQMILELKNIIVEGNKDTMNFMKSVIGHEQNMDVVKQQLKTEMTKTELNMKQAAMEAEESLKAEKEAWTRKQTEDRERWIREQKTENRALIRQAVTKILLIVGPILTAIIAALIKFIEKW